MKCLFFYFRFVRFAKNGQLKLHTQNNQYGYQSQQRTLSNK